MYTIHKTEGFILGGGNMGEANRYISIFTKDIGLVKVVARSAREERSKLRYGLQDFSHSGISLVRGRDVWRLTGASEQYNLHQEFCDSKDKLIVLARIFSLLRRLLHGEEKNDELFEVLSCGFEFTRDNVLNEELLKNFECIIALRILYTLGYAAKKSEERECFKEFLNSPHLNHIILENVSAVKDSMISEINKALKESHL